MGYDSGNGFVSASSGGGGSFAGLVETLNMQDKGMAINATTYTLELYAEYGYLINELKIVADSGTATAALQINGVSVTGINAVSVSSTIATGTATAANTVVVGNTITLVITSPTSLNNLKCTMKSTRT